MSDTSATSLNYDNNNEANDTKMKRQARRPGSKGAPPPTVTPAATRRSGRGDGRRGPRLNSLWSVWYGVLGTLLQAYAALRCLRRLTRLALLPWAAWEAVAELRVALAAAAGAVLLLPLFLAAAVFRVGNLANDGAKLGRGPLALAAGAAGGLWRHGGPTAASLHLVLALALLVPKLVMEARLIQAGYLPQDAVWRTDLDFMLVHQDRLVVLSFMTAAPVANGSVIAAPPPAQIQLPPPQVPPQVQVHNSTILRALPLQLARLLQEALGVDPADPTPLDTGWGSSVSVEFLNYALALLVYSVRYPAVFWAASRGLGAVFSAQLLANAVHSLLGFAALCVLYKVQVVGARRCLPLLAHGVAPPFLLDARATLALWALDASLVLASALALQLYGRARLRAFLCRARRSALLVTAEGTDGAADPSGDGTDGAGGYRAHCAALCVLAGTAAAGAPLLHDLAVLYRGSLDGAPLAGVAARAAHLLSWVALWLVLTLKTRWAFRVRVTVARARLRQPPHLDLLTELELAACSDRDRDQERSRSRAPLLVVGGGRAYAVAEPAPQKAIMSVVQKAAVARRARPFSLPEAGVAADDEQVYWLRPAASPGADSGASSPRSAALCFWARGARPARVSFHDASSTSGRRARAGSVKPRTHTVDDDDGDYATLRQVPLATADDTASEEGKLLERVNDDRVTYASGGGVDLVPPVDDYEDPSPLLTPEEGERASPAPGAAMPRCLRRADSGMPPEELTPRSGSPATASPSPPGAPTGDHSESSSGVHSSASSEPRPAVMGLVGGARRAGSTIDLERAREDNWRTGSLQRVASAAPHVRLNHQPHPQHMQPQQQQQHQQQQQQHQPQPHQQQQQQHQQSTAAMSADPYSLYGYARVVAVTSSATTAPADQRPVQSQSGSDKSSYCLYGDPHALYGYVRLRPGPAPGTAALASSGGGGDQLPDVVEALAESTVVIRREDTGPPADDEPFGRSTNMKMVSFTERAAATLPHFPTQPPAPRNAAHCSTMPLPPGAGGARPVAVPSPGPAAGPARSCGAFPRPQHTTLPTHHNGVRLFGPGPHPHRPGPRHHLYSA